MSSKFSLVPIVTRQYATLSDARTGRLRPDDFVVVLGVPLVVAGLAWGLGWSVTIVAELISAIAIITGLLFGLVVFLFQLRLQLGAPGTIERVPPVTIRLIDEMFANVSYAIVIGFVATGVTLVGAALRPDASIPGIQPGIDTFTTGLILGLTTHFLLVLAMCLKRLVSAYGKLAML